MNSEALLLIHCLNYTKSMYVSSFPLFHFDYAFCKLKMYHLQHIFSIYSAYILTRIIFVLVEGGGGLYEWSPHFTVIQ